MHTLTSILGNVLAIDIGGTSLRIGLVDQQGALSHFEKHPQADILQGDAIAALAQFIKDYLARHKSTAISCTLAIPGAINKAKTVVLNAPNIHGLDNQPITEILKGSLGIPIHLVRDVNTLFYYDLAHNPKLKNAEVVLGFYVGTGLGNCIYIGGKIFDGANGVAGELGHIPAYGYEKTCTCGNIGCIEPLAGGKYLTQVQKFEFNRTPIEELFVQHVTNPTLIDYIDTLAIAIATEVNILDPAYIVLGGGVISMADFPFEGLEAAIYKHARKPYPAENLKFIYSSDTHGTNGVIGGGFYGHQQI